MGLQLKFKYADIVYGLEPQSTTVELCVCPACKGRKYVTVDGHTYGCSLCYIPYQKQPTGVIVARLSRWSVRRMTLDPLLVRITGPDDEPDYGRLTGDPYDCPIEWWGESSLYGTLMEARRAAEDRNQRAADTIVRLREKIAAGECLEMIKGGYIDLDDIAPSA